ncbi:ATP-binding cassette domain-containing protein [Xanthomonas theicola]|nr:ATP-binding cassette domain-containing protein [Xanthomonas theicola]
MHHRHRHYPGQLSGGQQPRVAVACAPAGNRSILLADEPAGNLDSRNGEAVMQLLEQLHDNGVALCMVAHDAAFARRAQRIVHMLDGRIVDEDAFERVRHAQDLALPACAAVSWAEAWQSWRALARRPGYLLLAVPILALGVAAAKAVRAARPGAAAAAVVPAGAATGHPGRGRRRQPQPRRARLLPAAAAHAEPAGGRHRARVSGADQHRSRRCRRGGPGDQRRRGFPARFRPADGGGAQRQRPGKPAQRSAGGDPRPSLLATRFGGDPAAVGRMLQVQGTPVQVVGVLSARLPLRPSRST